MKAAKLQLPSHLVASIVGSDPNSDIGSLVAKAIENGLRSYEQLSEGEKRTRIQDVDSFLQKFRKERKDSDLVRWSSIVGQSSASTYDGNFVAISTRIDSELWKRTKDFRNEYNRASRDLESKIEVYAVLVFQAIDPDEPWPND